MPFVWITSYPELTVFGSAMEDFYCLNVDMENGAATCPIFNQGMGNWWIDAPEQWMNVSVDLRN